MLGFQENDMMIHDRNAKLVIKECGRENKHHELTIAQVILIICYKKHKVVREIIALLVHD